MRVTQLSSNLLQVTVRAFSNCYLLQEDSALTLIDTSFSGTAPFLLKTAAGLGLPIRRILLTHAHPDHIGSLDALHATLGDVEIGISAREAPLLEGDLRLLPGEPQKRLNPRFFPGTIARATRTLVDGETIGHLRCISTPGHTPGHMSFLDTRDGTLIAGDALIAFPGPLRVCTQTPWWNPLLKLFTWDKSLANQSARKLASIDFDLAVTGHGKAARNGKAVLLSALARLPQN